MAANTMLQQFTVKLEPEVEMAFNEAFPILFPFALLPPKDAFYMQSPESMESALLSASSTPSTSTSHPFLTKSKPKPKAKANLKLKAKSKNPKAKSKKPRVNIIPPLWVIERAKLKREYPQGVPKNRSLAELGVNKEQVIQKFMPQQRTLPSDVNERAVALKTVKNESHEKFIRDMMNAFPIDKSYHPNKARKYEKKDDDPEMDEIARLALEEARKANNGKSMVSRCKKKSGNANNEYTEVLLRELIIAFQSRMDFMKGMVFQTNMLLSMQMDECKHGETDSESVSSWCDGV